MLKMKKLVLILFLFFTTFAYASAQMVEIAVEITEINESEARNLGIKWNDVISLIEGNIPSIIGSGTWARGTGFSAALKALETKGVAKVLSKPKLVTKDGASASFMVGGEFPISVASKNEKKEKEDGEVPSVQWKKYGIIMNITPAITRNNKIDVVIDMELSRIDHSNGFSGCPAIIKRHAASNLQVKNGETIVLAGLIETTKDKIVKGIPLLCKIPYLGALFGSTRNVERKTNVLIFVTPKLI
jgi:pilus assembly protein CpaC